MRIPILLSALDVRVDSVAGYWTVGPGGDGNGEHVSPLDGEAISSAQKAKQGAFNGVKGQGEAEAEAESPVAERAKQQWPTPGEAANQEDK